MKNNIKFWQSELTRTCDFIKFSDQKAGAISVFYLAILGYIIGRKNEIILADHNAFFWICLTLLVLIFSAGFFQLVLIFLPRLDNHSTENSYLYFGHIKNMQINDFVKNANKLAEDKIQEQILEQIYIDSTIAHKKMESIQIATKLLFVLIFIAVILIFSLSDKNL